ncbi:relaxase/mobilization nuclease domain-containing protein [Echinicola marina]|uniref:relaxase/mobilization nuclease domain-containing protein n=1 Tax=Echinicola marina TaxID=2859768 RepID=UPI001CF6D953|nr:relaxase/mobilization nuclease domain-containing protein [Echinicola marina]UCS91669.1 relaxase/mobilization nuclease domain-containing protein [Echinicola marina]
MVARISLGRNILGLLYYNEDKVKEKKASVLMANGFGTNGESGSLKYKNQRFLYYTQKNSRAKLNAFHVSLNFSPKDQLDEAQKAFIAQEYMNRIGFGSQPYLVYEHMDAGHPHLHIVSTNITREGKRIETHNLGREKSEKARKELEKELGLVVAEQQKEQVLSIQPLESLKYGKKESKAAIGNIITEVMRTYSYGSIGEFASILRQFNIVLIQGEKGTKMYENKGLAYSALDNKGKRIGVPIKASAFYSKPTFSRLQKRMEHSKMKKEALVSTTRNKVFGALKISKGKGKGAFEENLKMAGLAADFHYSKDGKVFGLTIIDHVNRSAFKASELSRSLSGQKVYAQLHPKEGDKKLTKVTVNPPRYEKGPFRYSTNKDGPNADPYLWKEDGKGALASFISKVEAILRPEWEELADPFDKRKKRRKRRKKL